MWKVMGDYIMQSSKELGVVVLDNKVFYSGVMMGQLKRRRGVVGSVWSRVELFLEHEKEVVKSADLSNFDTSWRHTTRKILGFDWLKLPA
jgi:hypothetical protein